ncbi:MAG TPA: nucleotide exchange factor GrpE, partial [Phenylobacterium sp.]|nr:nucleotide exchange factor GrpE [Phenylobacterium sp.]
ARRRADEEVSKGRKFAIEGFAESLLPVLDSLEAGLAIQDATAEHLREGTEATLRQLKSALERNKVIEIAPPAGSKFDPHLHQAMMELGETDVAPGAVVEVMQSGYELLGRLVRPAMVVVAAKGASAGPAASSANPYAADGGEGGESGGSLDTRA